jgi:hypothetical protein
VGPDESEGHPGLDVLTMVLPGPTRTISQVSGTSADIPGEGGGGGGGGVFSNIQIPDRLCETICVCVSPAGY